MVDESFNCEDIYFNALTQELTGQPVIFPGKNMEFSCKSCGKGLKDRGRKTHYGYRSKCVGEHLIEYYGYSPLIEQEFQMD